MYKPTNFKAADSITGFNSTYNWLVPDVPYTINGRKVRVLVLESDVSQFPAGRLQPEAGRRVPSVPCRAIAFPTFPSG